MCQQSAVCRPHIASAVVRKAGLAPWRSTHTQAPLQPLQNPPLQAFCRVAAVGGALYVLRCPVDFVFTDLSSGAVSGVRTAAGEYSPRTAHLILGH